ncbi:thioredoxin family protein [Bacillus suaedaesalsae]|uniref:Thioredoxin family protein n=1 Tax=Bacillus suaedaesalsae TaxID=2810349 RepID=A0ABS2DK63_9BACI|nr:thioredoxin family protein [Bacillus suaedaesalsae]MBM6618890.1 thioredoxin family protein [Bacillus suaedaesalsae]
MEEWSAKEFEHAKQGVVAVFFYTPICGTCKLGERMLQVVKELLPTISFKKVNLNYSPELSTKLEIQSVPCLTILRNGEVVKQIFAFQSVEYLYHELSSI